MDKKIVAASALLNKPGFHSIAAIAMKVDFDVRRDWDEEERLQKETKVKGKKITVYKSVGYDARVVLSDCSRSITLDLSCATKKSYDNSLHKLNKMITILTQARNAMTAKVDEVKFYKKDDDD